MVQDVAVHALISAFAGENVEARFVGPTTVSVSLPEIGDVPADVTTYTEHAGLLPPSEIPGFAAEFARGFVQGMRRHHAGARAAAEASAVDIERLLAEDSLRIRLYTEQALADPPGLLAALATRPLAPGLVETVVMDLPDSIVPLNRSDLGHRTENEVFGAALRASIHREPHYVETQQLWGVPITHIGQTHRYVGAHAHVLQRHLRHAGLGALVSFPVPEYVLVHVIGDVHLVAAMETMQSLSRTHVEQGEHPLTPQVYWWRPGAHEDLPEEQALGSGLVPDLRPVEIEVDHEERSVTPRTAAAEELLTLWTHDG
ncbi:hypothetical protein [Nonomuraea wenchangensis]|uniref:hypothetical protein n=1 Tax=Nonomuraea wenchangensis TaxID=568860 RepID=UPI0033CE7773